MPTLDDILKDDSEETTAPPAEPAKEEAEAQEEQKAEPEKAAAEEEAQEEVSEETDKGEEAEPEKEAPAAETPSAEETGLKAALTAERKKRQDAEQALIEAQKPKPAPRPERPNAIEDPEAAIAHVEQDLGEMKTEAGREALKVKLEMSEAFARQQHDDYDAVTERWPDMVKQNPALVNDMVASPLPAQFAYEICKSATMLETIGDPTSFEERVRAEERAKVMAELENKEPGAQDTDATSSEQPLPKSLASETSKAGKSNAPAFSGPTPLEEIVPKT
ncbi:MAG: hypothetical protein ACR2QH_10490 [Geminicoccaceae bacterium]